MSDSPALLKAISIFAFLLTVTTSTSGISQTIDPTILRMSADAGEASAQLKLGEMLLFGGADVVQDTDAGLELISRAATDNFVPAKARMGKILLDGFYTAMDVEAGVALLEGAAASGNRLAQTTLGEALLWGRKIDADPMRAKTLLVVAANSGDRTAVRVLGEQLVGGWVLDQDIETGLPLLEKAAGSGDAKAQVALGKFLFYGTALNQQEDRALALFESAAKLGDGSGLQFYGAEKMWGEDGVLKAENVLVRSGELGVGAAWTSLAEGAMYGYLGQGNRRKFVGYAAKATELGETRIAVLQAQRQLYGISMRASGPKAITGLELAAADGNVDAMRFLISLVRDGNRLNVRKSPDKAAEYLGRFSSDLSEDETAQYALTIDAARTRKVADFSGLADRFYRQPELKSVEFGKEIFAANPNFAVFLLQTNFRREGKYDRSVDGFAGRSTLRAIYAACQTLGNSKPCGDTLLHPNVIGALLAR